MTIKDVKRELIVWAAVLLSAAYSAVVAAKPMDFEESKKIPRLKEILASVSSHGRINVSECRDIEKSLSCSNGVVVSLATWIVAQSKDSETNLYARIEANGVGGDLMSRAFARMSPIWKTARHDESRKNRPVYLIGQLARGKYAPKGSGGEYLDMAISYIKRASDLIGGNFIYLDCVPERQEYYERHGFAFLQKKHKRDDLIQMYTLL